MNLGLQKKKSEEGRTLSEAIFQQPVKARLLQEHWTLVVTKPEEASLAKFTAGDFTSVNLEQAIKRLSNIAGEDFPEDERNCFKRLGQHRNRIVHFLHQGYIGEAKPEVIAEVAAEQFRAWVYIHRLLTKLWSDFFEDFQDKIAALNERIKENKQFLAAKFAVIGPDLVNHTARGGEIGTCDSCGFSAACISQPVPPRQVAGCLVCDHAREWIIMPCHDCKTMIRFEDGEGECPGCHRRYDLDDLLEQFGPFIDPREEPEIGYSSNCGPPDRPTVVPHEGEQVCLRCASTFDRIMNCGCCGELIAGSFSDSFWMGCFVCDELI
jgi:hypothetical protein